MNKKLFIAMPYGVREDRLDHYNEKADKIILDFDAIWQGVIQPAIPQEFNYKRADELGQPGIIDKLYIEWLFNAEVVIADLSFGNPNVYYELGIRHVFSKNGTILIAQEGSKLPFDVRNQFVLYYDYFKAPSLPKFHKNLNEAINNAYSTNEDSPIHIYLPGINVHREENKKELAHEIKELKNERDALLESLNNFKRDYEAERYLEKINQTIDKSRLASYYSQVVHKPFNSILLYETLGIKLRKVGLITEAIQTFIKALEITNEDSDIFRELGFSYRLLGPDYFSKAQEYFYKALSITERDPELLGMIAGLYKRKGDIEQAKRFYEKANALVANDVYSIINLATLQLITGENDKSEINYKKVIRLTKEKVSHEDLDYWDLLTCGQAMLIIGDIEGAVKSYKQAIKLKIPVEDFRSEYEQLQFLKSHLISVDGINKIESMFFQKFNNKY